jgi:hypothetical protein
MLDMNAAHDTDAKVGIIGGKNFLRFRLLPNGERAVFRDHRLGGFFAPLS